MRKKQLQNLLLRIPSCKSRCEMVLTDSDGEILEYVVFGELTRFFVEQFNSGCILEVNRIQDFLVSLLAKNNEALTSLVVLGFLENLDDANKVQYKKIKSILKISLLKELKKLEDWKTGN